MRNLNGSDLSEQCSQMLAMWRHSRPFRVSFLCGNSCSRTVSSLAYMGCGQRDRKVMNNFMSSFLIEHDSSTANESSLPGTFHPSWLKHV
eukprot:s2916_g5.t1